MTQPPERVQDGRALVALAQRDKRAATETLAAMAPEVLVALVCETPTPLRAALLALLERPEAVIPQLPEAELCFTVKAVGLHDAGWILAHASDDQLVACMDLDTFVDDRLVAANMESWIDALGQAGDARLLRGIRLIDPEALMLFLRGKIEVFLKESDDDWEQPLGSRTLDGQFYYRALDDKDDLATLTRALTLLASEHYWHYFRLFQGVLNETDAELEVWTHRWRTGRLMDLGFPPAEEALELYARIPDGQIEAISPAPDALGSETWRLPIWPPRLPVEPDAGAAVFRAAAGLDGEERTAFLYAFLAAANGIAVLERLPLGEAESVPAAIEKTAALASDGVSHLARFHSLGETEILRRVPIARLVRVGANLGLQPLGRLESEPC